MGFTVRKQYGSFESWNTAQDLKELLSGAPVKTYTKSLSGPFNGEFKYESDNEFIDFYSYWEKIRQTRLASYPEIVPFLSSVRKSSVRLEINPAQCEVKEVALKLRLWTQKPNRIMAIISKPLNNAVEQEIQSLPSLTKALSFLRQAPATILKAETSLKRNSAVEKIEAFAVIGYNPIDAHRVKSTAAAAIKLSQGGERYAISYEGELQRPKINARWNKEQLLNQPLELKYNAKVAYGDETNQQSQEEIVLRSVFHKSSEQIRSVHESKEFRKCAKEASAGRRLSPICIKVRNQAGSVDTAEIHLDVPQQIYNSRVRSTVEGFVKANFWANYRPQPSASQMPLGKIRLDLNFARAGDVADVKVAHKNDAYILKTIRIPRNIQGVMPLCVRNPSYNWINQIATDNYAPVSCRIEPEIVSTFDNNTYRYKINDCEHVLMLDGSRTLPLAVVARKVSGEQKLVKILSGITKVELIPSSGSLKVKVNGHQRSINQGETIVEKNAQTGEVIVEIKHYQDGVHHVYVPNQLLHVVADLHVFSDGNRIEVVAPQLLKNRAVGLCGNLNGEEVADLPSPQKCIMRPRFAAYSYMLNKEGTSAPRCAGIPQQDVPEYKREVQQCHKEEIIPTTIVPLFERARTLGMPLGGMETGGNNAFEMHGANGASEMDAFATNGFGSGAKRCQDGSVCRNSQHCCCTSSTSCQCCNQPCDQFGRCPNNASYGRW